MSVQRSDFLDGSRLNRTLELESGSRHEPFETIERERVQGPATSSRHAASRVAKMKGEHLSSSKRPVADNNLTLGARANRPAENFPTPALVEAI